MSSEMYTQLVEQLQILDYTEKLEILSIITNSLKTEHLKTKTNSTKEKLINFESFKGCMKDIWQEDSLKYQTSLREDRNIV